MMNQGSVSSIATASATNVSGKVAKRMAARELYESLKPQGYKTKSASLEEVIRKTEKREAKLIGYDETPESPAIQPNNQKGTGHPTSAFSKTAKSHLSEVCVANYWKPPTYECAEERGPSTLKEFVFKINLEIDERPNHLFEIYGETRMRKKDAAESAAEGALWFLKKNKGYILD